MVPLLGAVTGQVGDTWVYGCASDPLKLAKIRAIVRAHGRCHRAGRCGAADEPAIAAFRHYAMKLFEHTCAPARPPGLGQA